MRIRYISPAIPPLVVLSMFGLNDLINILRNRFSGNTKKIGLAGIYLSVSILLCLNALYIYDQFRIVSPLNFISGRVGRDAYIEQYPNGWYRCAISVFYNLSTSGTYNCGVRLAEADGDDYIPRDGQTYIYAYGGQVEKNDTGDGNLSPTSYIPTLGSIVTRNAETTKKLNVSNYINSKKGVLYGEYAMDTENLSGVLNRINIYGTGTADRISIGYYAGGPNQIRAKYVKNVTEVYDTIGKFEGNETEFIKVAFRWQEGLHTLYVNGEKIKETTPPSSAVFNDNALEKIIFGKPEEDYFFNGHIKEVMVFDELLSDSQMQELTIV